MTERSTTGAPTASVPGRLWTKGLVITVAVVLSVPILLGAVVGFFEINPVAAELDSTVGEDAHLLLAGFPDDSLTVEFAYQEAAGPPPGAAVATLLARINETCAKASVTVEEHGFASSVASVGDAELLSLVEQQRHHWPSPGSLSLFYLYLAGNYSSDPSAIGLAFRATSIAVFSGAITTGGLGANAVAITTTVLVHEFGHELGLVGIYGSAPNEDHAHPPHSNDPTDVMYWEVDSTRIGLLGGGPPNQFDAADLADLGNVKGAPIPLELLPWGVLVGCIGIAVYFVRTERRERRRRTPPAP